MQSTRRSLSSKQKPRNAVSAPSSRAPSRAVSPFAPACRNTVPWGSSGTQLQATRTKQVHAFEVDDGRCKVEPHWPEDRVDSCFRFDGSDVPVADVDAINPILLAKTKRKTNSASSETHRHSVPVSTCSTRCSSPTGAQTRTLSTSRSAKGMRDSLPNAAANRRPGLGRYIRQSSSRGSLAPESALREFAIGEADRLAKEQPEWEEWAAALNKSMEIRLASHLKDCSKCRCFSQFSQKSGLKRTQISLTESALSSLCRNGVQDLNQYVTDVLLAAKSAILNEIADSLSICSLDLNDHEKVEQHRRKETFASLMSCSTERERVVSQEKMRKELIPTLERLCHDQLGLRQWRNILEQGYFNGRNIPHRYYSVVTAEEAETAAVQLFSLQAQSAHARLKAWESKWDPESFEKTFSLFGSPLFDLGLQSMDKDDESNSTRSNEIEQGRGRQCAYEQPAHRWRSRSAANRNADRVDEQALLVPAGWTQVGHDWIIDLDDNPLKPEEIAQTRPMTVIVRLRPILSHESGDKLTVRVMDDNVTVRFKGQLGSAGPGAMLPEQSLLFDHALTGSQSSLFSNSGVKALVHRAHEGFTATIFAYGQTGAGKTHSLLGPAEVMGTFADDQPCEGPHSPQVPDSCRDLIEAARKVKVSHQGLLPRSIQFLFNLFHEADCTGMVVNASFVEVYNERVYDLLNPASGALDVRQRPSQDQGFYVPGRTDVPCRCPADLLRILCQGVAVRHTSSHSLSRESSRAHAIFTMEFGVPGDKTGRLVFADLAGSERAKKIDGANVYESAAINKSLLMLSNCISALASSDSKNSPSFVSAFRNSKLTKMMMESLCGQGYTLLLAAISPAERHLDETANTLHFAAKCSNIRKSACPNITPHAREVQDLKSTIRILRKELIEAQAALVNLPSQDLPPSPRHDSDDEQECEVLLAKTHRILEIERRRNVALSQENELLRREMAALQASQLAFQSENAIDAGTGGVDDNRQGSPGSSKSISLSSERARKTPRWPVRQGAEEEEEVYEYPDF